MANQQISIGGPASETALELGSSSQRAAVAPEAPAFVEPTPITRALRQWYERAGVRADPRRVLLDEAREGLSYWPAELAPFVEHPLVIERGAALREELLVRQLYQYLQFTASYETRVINPATELIANGRSGIVLPPQARIDAYKIYCDEGYHALYSADALSQVEAASGVAPGPFEFDTTLRSLRDAQDAAPGPLRNIVPLLVATVFETLVTATLTQIPRQKGVASFVREIVTDHARDECRHHAYFSRFFSYLWGQLSSRERRSLGPLLPEFVVRPLQPQVASLHRSLAAAQLTEQEIECVLHDSFPREQTESTIRRTAQATLSLFARHDLFDDPATREAFVKFRLIAME